MLKNPNVDLKVAAKGIRQYLERMEQQAPQFAQVKLICVGEGNVRVSSTWVSVCLKYLPSAVVCTMCCV